MQLVQAAQSVQHVPVDLERQHIGEKFSAHGFDVALPSFISMIGVAQYLTATAVDAVLQFASTLPKRSVDCGFVCCTDDQLSSSDRQAAAMSMAYTASLGDPSHCSSPSLRDDQVMLGIDCDLHIVANCFILGRVALLDRKKLNVGVTVFVRFAQSALDRLARRFARTFRSPGNVESYRMSGQPLSDEDGHPGYRGLRRRLQETD